MAIAFVGATHADPGLTINRTPTAGNLLIASSIDADSHTQSDWTVSGGGTWVSTIPAVVGGTGTTSQKWYYCLSATGGASTFTLAGTAAGDNGGIWTVMEYAWNGATGTFDTNVGHLFTGANPTGDTLTPGGANALVVGGWFNWNTNAFSAFTGSWTLRESDTNAFYDIADQITGSGVAVTVTASADNATILSALSFLPAAGAAGLIRPSTLSMLGVQ